MPFLQGIFTPIHNFVSEYLGGQKKIRADYMDENFDDIASALTNMSDGKADDDDVVHKAGTETITGNKTFTGSVSINKSGTANALLTSPNYDKALGVGGTSANSMGRLLLYGANYSTDTALKGAFELQARTSSTPNSLIGYSPSSSDTTKANKLFWRDGEVVVSGETSTMTLGNNRYNNNSGWAIWRPDNDGRIVLVASNNGSDSASLELHGGDYATNPGAFDLEAQASNGTSKHLIGSPDGTLTWNGNDIALDSNVVHKSGTETISGSKTFSSEMTTHGLTNTVVDSLKRDRTNSYLRLCGGTSTSDGAYLALTGNTYSNPGWFIIHAANGTNDVPLIGKPDGTLTWNGNEVLTVASPNKFDAPNYKAGVNKTSSVKSNAGYTTTSAGWMVFQCYGGETTYVDLVISIDATNVGSFSSALGGGPFVFPVKSGKVVKVTGNTGLLISATFYPSI